MDRKELTKNRQTQVVQARQTQAVKATKSEVLERTKGTAMRDSQLEIKGATPEEVQESSRNCHRNLDSPGNSSNAPVSPASTLLSIGCS
jgi:hypothetical protein